jgi:hypothetical protein
MGGGRSGAPCREPVRFEAYAVGPCYMSVCTNLEVRELETRANLEYPTGISSRWQVSKDATFRNGQPNPCPCERGGGCMHYLLDC